jgi:hypothetical protein
MDFISLFIKINEKWEVLVASVSLVDLGCDDFGFHLLSMEIVNAALHAVASGDKHIHKESQAFRSFSWSQLGSSRHDMDIVKEANIHHWIW